MASFIGWKPRSLLHPAAARPGSGPAAIQVFEAAADIKAIKISEHMMMMQADAGTLKVDELYTVDNQSTPPRTKAGQRAFEIYLPDGATLQNASAQIPNGMPLKAGLAPTGEKNQY